METRQDNRIKTKRKFTRIILYVILLGIWLVFSASLIIYRKNIAIQYHKHSVKTLMNQTPRYHPATGIHSFGNDWLVSLEYHKDKLVELGYFQRNVFVLQTIQCQSLRYQRLIEELGERFPDNPFIQSTCDPNTPVTMEVWDTPENLKEWERIISAHDVPATNTSNIPQQ